MRLSFSWYLGKQLIQLEKKLWTQEIIIPVLTKVEAINIYAISWAFSTNEQMF